MQTNYLVTSRFQSVEEVLSYAFAMEAKQVRAKSIFHDARGYGEDILERIADGMMIKSLCLRYAGYRGKDIIIAHYTVPVPELEKKKNDYIEKVALWLGTETHRDKWCLADGVREWAGERPHHDPKWWADHLDRSVKTIQRYWYSKDPKDASVNYLLTLWENKAAEKISEMLPPEVLT